MALTRKVRYRSDQILNQLFNPDTNELSVQVNEFGVCVQAHVEFDGAETNDPGDFDGTGNPHTLFTVTGTVLARVFGVSINGLEGTSATLSVGTALSPAGLIAQTTATDIDTDEIWHDSSPDASIEASTILVERIVNQDIIQTVGTASITDGSITYICLWKPLTEGSHVAVAG